MKKHVVPFLVEHQSQERDGSTKMRGLPHNIKQNHYRKQVVAEFNDRTSTEMVSDGSSSYQWPSSVKSFFRELVALAVENDSD